MGSHSYTDPKLIYSVLTFVFAFTVTERKRDTQKSKIKLQPRQEDGVASVKRGTPSFEQVTYDVYNGEHRSQRVSWAVTDPVPTTGWYPDACVRVRVWYLPPHPTTMSLSKSPPVTPLVC